MSVTDSVYSFNRHRGWNCPILSQILCYMIIAESGINMQNSNRWWYIKSVDGCSGIAKKAVTFIFQEWVGFGIES